ncbi:MAG: small basic protein, partial [Planctomycetota bacterium]|jgi:small basic protein (TIGR04137 family)
MSLHRSLKTKPGALNQHRNVLTRAERIARLSAQNRFDPDESSPLGLCKVTSRAAAKKKKAAKQEEQEQKPEEGETAPTPGK